MAPSLNENPADNAAPRPQAYFKNLTWLLMKNSGLPGHKFRAKFLELARDAQISQKDWCHDILQNIDSKTMFKLAPMNVSAEEYSKFIGLCESQLRPLYPRDKLPDQSTAQGEKLGSSSLLDSSTPLPEVSKPNARVMKHSGRSSNQNMVNGYDGVPANSNDLDFSVRFTALSKTDSESLGFLDYSSYAILMNRQLLMTARPNVVVGSENRRAIRMPDGSKLMEVGATVGRDTMDKPVRVAGFEADGRPFFETFPEFVVRGEDGKRVFRIGYDANGKPIHGLFDKDENFEGIYEKGYIWSKPTERFDGYIKIGDLVDNDKGLPVDDMR
ncbi:hypothetical protein OCU04_003411 [Sclerotinia nivalis]|uniref:Uncharacterized protein n=1 Tax=Sclerotinia nivalis TaxID=352851 RepID=A0A9X0DMP1_9HELO|nr:hypothetical protein OCU04_003411 [Sclerotinia nivalis]